MSAVVTSLLAVATLAPSSQLQVQLVDAAGKPRPVSGVLIFLTDEAGAPVTQAQPAATDERPSPFLHSFGMITNADSRRETTNKTGSAVFDDIAPGRYRVIAQKWDQVEGYPTHPKGYSSTDLWRLIPNGVTSFGIGTADVKPATTTSLEIPPLGTSQLAITVKQSHRGNLLSVSLGKPLVMPELAASIMNRHLDRDAVLVQHVSQTDGDIILRGLPSDREVTVALMAYDNSPGLGGIVTKAGPGIRRQIKVHAGWSDAEPLPEPDSLKSLMEFIQKNGESLDLFQLLGVGSRDDFLLVEGRDYINEMKLYDEASHVAEKVIDIEGFGETAVADFMTARGFVERRKREAAQRKRDE